MAEIGLTRNQILMQLVRSEHGELKNYVEVGKRATKDQPEFMAHLIAWDKIKGQIRDAKIALPMVSLLVADLHPEFVENSLAHLSLLGPREMLKAYHFALDIRPPNRMTTIRRVLAAKLLQMEKNWPKWERTMLQHRGVLQDLFALLHFAPADERTNACLWKRKGKTRLAYPQGGLFHITSQLSSMSALEAAGTVMKYRIPFMVAQAALGAKLREADTLIALIGAMTSTELVTNTKNLEKWGMKTNPAVRGAFQAAIEKAGKGTANVLKASEAADALEDVDENLAQSMRGLQEKQISKLSGVEGDWLVLADKSGSMSQAINTGKEIAALLAKLVKGKVLLTFFDESPRTIDVTGKSFDEIKSLTKHVTSAGATCIGCGLLRLCEEKTAVDGIVIVSDGGENRFPAFATVYKTYSQLVGKEVPVYLYQLAGDSPVLIQNMKNSGFDLQVFDLMGHKLDYYSLPNLVATMRTNRYSLIDEIMDTRLLVLPEPLRMTTSLTKTS
jgi:hypothetical protein